MVNPTPNPTPTLNEADSQSLFTARMVIFSIETKLRNSINKEDNNNAAILFKLRKSLTFVHDWYNKS